MTEQMFSDKSPKPPLLAARIIHRFGPSSLNEGQGGDIEEVFRQTAEARGTAAAARWIRQEAAGVLARHIQTHLRGGKDMILNYLKVTFRNIAKTKLFSVINIIGLSLGIASAVLIFLFIQNERSYDRLHGRADRIFRAYITEDPPDRDAFSYVHAPFQLGPAFEDSLPEVEEAVRLETLDLLLKSGENSYRHRIHLADPGFFQVFDFPLLKGNRETVLDGTSSIVLTRSLAQKIFGSPDVLGRRILIQSGDGYSDYFISGIAADPPANSSIRFEAVIPMTNTRQYHSPRSLNHWLSVRYETYVLLAEPIAPDRMAAKLKRVVQTHYPEQIAGTITLHLQPLTEIHLNPSVPRGFEPVSDPLYGRILMGIAFLILGIACINFLTLALGGSLTRAREVGVRKVLGAHRPQLVTQFLGETLVMSSAALAAGLVLVRLFLPAFNTLTGKELAFAFNPGGVLFLLGLVGMTGLAAGIYPAFALSRFQPADVMHRTPRVGGAGLLIKGLVVLQFVLAVGFLVCTFIMGRQLRFLLEKNLGYDASRVVVVENGADPGTSADVLKRIQAALSSQPMVSGVAGSSGSLTGAGTRMGFRDRNGDFRSFAAMTVDEDFLDVLEMELLEGRNFSPDFGTDPAEAVIVNEAFLRYFQWETGVDQKLPGPDFPVHRIIGVVKDFHFQDLQNEVEPLALVLDPTALLEGISDINTSVTESAFNYIYIRLRPGDISGALKDIKSLWTSAVPDLPFRFIFLDEDVQNQYREVKRWETVVQAATFFTILIACMGLFGLSALTVARRTKEIGVRKVLGASAPRIVGLLSRDFGLLVLAANLAAWPAAYVVMRRWLVNFAFRVKPDIPSFVLAALLALTVALLTVGWQTVRAALTDPVRTIRRE